MERKQLSNRASKFQIHNKMPELSFVSPVVFEDHTIHVELAVCSELSLHRQRPERHTAHAEREEVSVVADDSTVESAGQRSQRFIGLKWADGVRQPQPTQYLREERS